MGILFDEVFTIVEPEVTKPAPAAAEKAPRERGRRPPLINANRWVVHFEMPDGGDTISFPMSADEIETARQATSQSAQRKQAAQDAITEQAADTITTHVEMADGNIVTFIRKRPANNEGELLSRK